MSTDPASYLQIAGPVAARRVSLNDWRSRRPGTRPVRPCPVAHRAGFAVGGQNWRRKADPMHCPTVLIVDDDPDIRELTSLVLRTVNGWRTITADGGDAAIKMCRANPPDAVLLDWMMPDMDGLETFEHLQADEATRRIPVILFTAKVRVGQHRPWGWHGIRGVITKPYNPATLGNQITQIVGCSSSKWSNAS
ncbi:MAG TPA: response regulator [Nocardioides sp.]|nr:response regulator [Nocardioides sp.]HRI96833.1 response regulator [Nocardioides sp.]